MSRVQLALNVPDLDEAVAPLSLTLHLEDDLDVARGELIAAALARSKATSAGARAAASA